MDRFKTSFLLLPLLLGAGCLPQTQTPQPQPTPVPSAIPEPQSVPSAEPSPAAATTTGSGPVRGTYVPFTRSAYDASLANGEPILLFFYANWCPYCKAQDPVVASLFRDMPPGVTAYRVNYNDSETDAEEKRLANAFGVTYQHTFVLLDKNGKEAARRVGTMSAEELKTFLEKAR